MSGFKTLIFNAALAAFGVFEVADWTSVLGSEKAGYAMMVVSVIGIVLRFVTNGPVGGKPSE